MNLQILFIGKFPLQSHSNCEFQSRSYKQKFIFYNFRCFTWLSLQHLQNPSYVLLLLLFGFVVDFFLHFNNFSLLLYHALYIIHLIYILNLLSNMNTIMNSLLIFFSNFSYPTHFKQQ